MRFLITLYVSIGMLFLSAALLAQDVEVIEQVEIVGTKPNKTVVDLNLDTTFIESIMPAMAFTPGGYGGFASFNERGTMSSHTTVFRNGVPINDASTGLSNFANIPTVSSQSATVVNGLNGVLYGSGSLGGTIHINDEFGDHSFIRVGEEHSLLGISRDFNNYSAEIISFDTTNGSVMSNNTEEDNYQNLTTKFKTVIGDFELIGMQARFDYDYDNCYASDFSLSQNCVQKGTETFISLRNDSTTFGYSKNVSDFETNDIKTYETDSSKLYFDYRRLVQHNIMLGVTALENTHFDDSDTEVSVYAMYRPLENLQLGARANQDTVVYRTGFLFNDFNFSLATSYRTPTLYEQLGDAWVNSNNLLDPEEGVGAEVGYKNVQLFWYDFSEGIEYNFSKNQFINTGEYSTLGARYMNTFFFDKLGTINVMFGYTDTDLPRVPKWKTAITQSHKVGDFILSHRLAVQHKRNNDFDGTQVEDFVTFDISLTKQITKHLKMSFTMQDATDREFEIIPGYNAGGRKFFLTFVLQ